MGIMPLDYDTRQWWSHEGVHGIGMRPCSILNDIVRVRGTDSGHVAEGRGPDDSADAGMAQAQHQASRLPCCG